MEDSPRIVGYEESETEEKPPPSAPEYQFLLERPTEAGVPYRPPHRERIMPPRKQRTSLSRILNIVCLVGLAASTSYLTYVAYLAPESLPQLKENVLGLRKQVDELKTTISSIEAKSGKSAAFANWLNGTSITSPHVYLPDKPRITIEFVKSENDEKYGIRRNDWHDFEMGVTCQITNSFGIVHDQTLAVLSKRTFELTEKNLTKEFPADRYRLTIKAIMGKPAVAVASVAREFEVKVDLIPPLIEWRDRSWSDKKLTVRAWIYDAEGGKPYSVKISYRFVFINRTITMPHGSPIGGVDMKESESEPFVYSYSFADTRPAWDLNNANITFYYIEAKDRRGNRAYSEPVYKEFWSSVWQPKTPAPSGAEFAFSVAVQASRALSTVHVWSASFLCARGVICTYSLGSLQRREWQTIPYRYESSATMLASALGPNSQARH